MNDVAREITRAVKHLALPEGNIRELPPADAGAIVESMLSRFVDPPNRTWWWEGFKLQYFVALNPNDVLDLLRKVVPDESEKLFLLSTPDGDAEICVFEAASRDIFSVLSECYRFEFVILHQSFKWLVCESHHGQVFAVGEPVMGHLAAACAASDITLWNSLNC